MSENDVTRDIPQTPYENVDRRPTDDKDRVLVDHMSTDEMLREVVTQLRVVEDVLDALGESPAISAMMQGGNPMMAMLSNGRK